MKNYSSITKLFLFLFVCLFAIHGLQAQSGLPEIYQDSQVLKDSIKHNDHMFWEMYNSCDTSKMEEMFTKDVEFYHDKGGLTETSAALIKSIKTNLCGENSPKLRREAIEGSVEIFPMNNTGAIISGEHKFYITEKGKNEYLTGIARFTHLWVYRDGKWKMSRVFSYDHHAPEPEQKTAVTVSENLLDKYAGEYNAPQTGLVIISKSGNGLKMKAGKMLLELEAESSSKFFHQPSGLEFEFVTNEENEVVAMKVYENGNLAEEATRK